jgi:hypothetical protein
LAPQIAADGFWVAVQMAGNRLDFPAFLSKGMRLGGSLAPSISGSGQRLGAVVNWGRWRRGASARNRPYFSGICGRFAWLRAIGGTALRALALEKGVIAAAPFSAEDTVRLLDKGFPMIVNLNEALRIPQSVFVTRGEVLQKYPETTKRFLKAVILGMQFAKHNKQEAIKIGYTAGLKGEPDVVSRAYDLFSPGYAADLSVAQDGIQIMLDEDIRAGVVEKNFTLDRVINDKILKQAQQELRKEGRLK